MLIAGQNTINGTLSLEINDPFLNGVKRVNVHAN